VPAQNTDYLYKLFRKLGLSDFGAQTAQVLIQRPFEILLIVVAAIVLTRLGTRLARRSVQGLVTRSTLKTDAAARTNTRAETLAGVAASLVRISIWTIAVLLIIDKLGVNPGPVLAGASIVGVAVGFGAQSLVKDFLSGFFVLAEDQYGVGDAVTLGDVTGTVEEVNLRITRVRATDGTVWFVPNGEIRKVGNSDKDWARAIVDVTIPTGADVGAATAAVGEAVSSLAEDPGWADAVLEPPEVLGVESISADDFTVRVTAKTKLGQRAKVARELRARIGAALRREGIVPLAAKAAPSAAAAPAGPAAPAES
jgi:small conductance mechanosensitive channel